MLKWYTEAQIRGRNRCEPGIEYIFFPRGGCEGLVGVVCLYRRHHLFRVLRVGDFLAGDDGTEAHGGDIEAEHRGEEGVVPCLVDCESLFGVPGEQTGDQVLCLGGEVLGQGVPQIIGLQEGLLDRVALERRGARETCVQNAAQRPHVGGQAVGLSVDNLGTYVVRSPTHGVSLLCEVLQFHCQAEIADFYKRPAI